MEKNNVYLASKPRYEILDGLRGVAALTVVAFHLFETYSAGPDFQILNHGYLAVDFFFVLSGFVIGYAYDDRWYSRKSASVGGQKGGEHVMTLWNFCKRRLLRLHPMVIFGTLFGGFMFYFGTCSAFPLIADTPWWKVILVAVWCFTMIPLPASMDIRGWGETNPLNGPAWSLQWEYLANVLYALVFRHLPKAALAACVAVFAVFTVLLCFNIDVFGVLSVRDYAAYRVIGGWSLTPDQLQIGLTRLLYPFFCGLLLSRILPKFNTQSSMFKVKRGFWWCAVAILIILCMPCFGGAGWVNGLYESVAILVVFPLIVAVGASSSVTGKKSSAVNKFLGDTSYPIYITHYPLVYMQMSWAEKHADAPLSTHVFVGVSIFMLTILLAYAAYRLYDLPVREWLKGKLFKPLVR